MSIKRPKRPLDTIAAEIRARAETIGDIIEIGGLLVEAKRQLKHGEWLPWLEHEFDFSERTAQNYMKAYRFSRKYETVADSKLSPSALYDVADGSYCYTPEAIDLILKEATEKRVNADRAFEIAFSLNKTPGTDEDRRPESGAEAEAEAEAEAILDGPPPDLPSPPSGPPPLPRHESLLNTFRHAVGELRKIMTTPSAKFVAVDVSGNELAAVAAFLQQIASAKAKARAA